MRIYNDIDDGREIRNVGQSGQLLGNVCVNCSWPAGVGGDECSIITEHPNRPLFNEHEQYILSIKF